MDELLSGKSSSKDPSERRLDSWKEIASYLGRDVTTVQRWEKREGMPVHRHVHERRGSVYAFGSELEAWQQSRKLHFEGEETDRDSMVDAQAALGHREQGRTRRWYGLASIALLGLLALAYVVARNGPKNTTQPKIRSLAVLPLKNLTGDPSQEYLADGMTDALIGRLSTIHDLRVVSRTSVMRFKNPQNPVPEIAKILGVDAIVEGSVMREGNRIRVTAQLIRAATDEHFWSETYDRDLKDVLALESDLAQSIVTKIEVTVTGSEHQRLAVVRSVSPEVYENYLKGKFVLDNKRNRRADIDESIGYFQEAIKSDPTFALAYLGLASAYQSLGSNMIGVSPEETRPKALIAVRKALELDPDISDAHLLLADIEQKQLQWADSEAEYRRALELNPKDADAQFGFSQWLLCQGYLDEALEWARSARELDPVEVSGGDVGYVLFNARRYEEAIHEFRSTVAVWPDDTNTLWMLGMALLAHHRPEEAIPVLKKAVSISDRDPGIVDVLARAYAEAGRRSDALRLLAELRKGKQAGAAGGLVNAYVGLHEYDQAFAALAVAYEEKSNILQWLKVNPLLDPLRDDPRFKDLLHRVGLDQEIPRTT